MTDELKLENYVYDYRAAGREWTIKIPAYNREEADAHIAAISGAYKFIGVVVHSKSLVLPPREAGVTEIESPVPNNFREPRQ